MTASNNLITLCSIVLALLCFAVQPTVANDEFSGTLSGRVVDKNGHPIRFASAYLLPQNIRVDVDAEGFYALDNIEPGTYYLAIAQPGYRMYLSSPIQFANARKERRVLILRMAAEDSENEYNQDLAQEFERVLNQCKLQTSTTTPRNADGPRNTPTTTTEEHAGDFVSTVSVTPVPTTDKATCTFTLRDNANVMIEVFSITSGSRVALLDAGTYTKGTQSYSLNTSGLPSGTYTLLVRASSCEYALTTFIKE